MPTATPAYALLDVGDARRLERFGDIVVDRPAPTAEGHVAVDPAAWPRADARFNRSDRGPVAHEGWTTRDGRPLEPWAVDDGAGQFELRLAPSGQVGLFPEQATLNKWIGRQAARLARPVGRTPTATRGADGGSGSFSGSASVLNLFGYTGAATIAVARAGVPVTHLDASRPAVAWARHNAALNDLAEAPIRWIGDDAAGFVERELRRGRHYAGIVLDPPSYGHSGAGRAWRLGADLPALLGACAELLDEGPAFIALSAHTPGFGPQRLGELLLAALEPIVGAGAIAAIEVDDQTLISDGGTRLHLGAMARWTR
ncbi:MAG: class I SAM-dependent rRNA methyltransferase [Candidatus Limnocylindrales bacterium]